MNLFEITLIAIGLAMDCFAVSFSAGVTQRELRFKHAVILGLAFGFFQGMMPVIGWLGGEAVVSKLSMIDHWIAFALLAFIGGKMLYDALFSKEEEKKSNVMVPTTLLLLAIATSIDALVVGFSFSMMQVDKIALAFLIIGICSFLFSVAGVYTGKTLSNKIKSSYVEIAGGLILIGIGTKILIEHLIS